MDKRVQVALAKEWLRARGISNDVPTGCVLDEWLYADMLAAYAESECSRLASRVEELETLLDYIKTNPFITLTEQTRARIKRTLACPTCQGSGRVTICIDEHGMQDDAPCPECRKRVLAEAHAEEK